METGLAPLDTAAGRARSDACIQVRLFLPMPNMVFDGMAEKEVRESVAELLARIGLFPPRSDVPVAHREFHIVEAAPTVDAAGGVAGFRRASDLLASKVAEWITELDQAPGGGRNGRGRCGA